VRGRRRRWMTAALVRRVRREKERGAREEETRRWRKG
jgi:hypothetical protein